VGKIKERVSSSSAAQNGGQKTNHYAEAERLCVPRERNVQEREQLRPMWPADNPAAQVHATLAVADQLARIAAALERLAGQGPA
jgi:hypothetical protein